MTSPAADFACQIRPPQRKTWADVGEYGTVRHDQWWGWHIDFRSVDCPGGRKRRVRVAKVPRYGRLDTEQEATKAQLEIQAECLTGRRLFDVLADCGAIEHDRASFRPRKG